MKKRLRKKLHRGEFTEYGCCCKVGYDVDFDTEAFLDATVDHLESKGLYISGGVGPTGADFFVHSHEGSLREEQREELKTWFEACSGVSSVAVGPLIDVWACEPCEH